jgi:hypothetical protein
MNLINGIYNWFYVPLSLTEKIKAQGEYAQILPKDLILHILSFLPLEEQASNKIALINYHFYIVTKPLRDTFNKELFFATNNIIKFINDSKYSITRPNIGHLIPDLYAQFFEIECRFVYNQNNALKELRCNIQKKTLSTTNDSLSNIPSRNAVGEYKFAFMEMIDPSTGRFFSTFSSGRLSIFKSRNLNPLLKKVVEKVLNNVNQNRP